MATFLPPGEADTSPQFGDGRGSQTHMSSSLIVPLTHR